MNKLIKRIMKNIPLVIVFFLGFIPAIAHGGSWNGWIYQDPYPTGIDLGDVKFISPMKGWIVGNYGTILHTEDGGDTWEAQESGTEEAFSRVFFVNEKTGWAAGVGGSIIHTEDGGKTWAYQYNVKAYSTALFFLNEKEGWVTGATPLGVVYRTKDSGKTWTKYETGITRAIASIYFVNVRTGWILAGEDVYRTTDGGTTWEKAKLPIGKLPPRPRPRIPPMFMKPGDMPSTMMKPEEEEGLGNDWRAGDITFVNEKQGWATVLKWIFHTEDGGKTWTMQLDTDNLDHDLVKISFRDAQNGCASGWTLYCTTDGGKTWQEKLGAGVRTHHMLGGVSLVGPSDGWAVGSVGRLFKTTDNGRSWKRPYGGHNCGSEVFFVNKKTGWRYEPGVLNAMCRTDDGGHTWERQDVGIQVRDLFFVNDLTGWAVGAIEEWKNGKEDVSSENLINAWRVIRYTNNGGKTWITQYKKSTDKRDGFPGLTGITFIDPNKGWAVGIKGTILHTEDGGKHWRHQQDEDAELYLDRVQFIDAKTGWITGTQVHDSWTGIILSTEDGGNHWRVQHKLRDVGFDDLHFIDYKSGWIAGEAESGEVGVILHTEDGGKTWSEKEFENIGLNRMAFLDKMRGVIYSTGVLKTGFMIITTDGGNTWSKRRVPLRKYPWHISELFEKGANDSR